jgi:hypothetical protein
MRKAQLDPKCYMFRTYKKQIMSKKWKKKAKKSKIYDKKKQGETSYTEKENA